MPGPAGGGGARRGGALRAAGGSARGPVGPWFRWRDCHRLACASALAVPGQGRPRRGARARGGGGLSERMPYPGRCGPNARGRAGRAARRRDHGAGPARARHGTARHGTSRHGAVARGWRRRGAVARSPHRPGQARPVPDRTGPTRPGPTRRGRTYSGARWAPGPGRGRPPLIGLGRPGRRGPGVDVCVRERSWQRAGLGTPKVLGSIPTFPRDLSPTPITCLLSPPLVI